MGAQNSLFLRIFVRLGLTRGEYFREDGKASSQRGGIDHRIRGGATGTEKKLQAQKAMLVPISIKKKKG